MKTFARILEFGLGIFFVASSLSKSVNVEAFAVQISLYGVIESPALLEAAAYGTIIVEAALGALFLSGGYLKGLAYFAAIGLTTVFTGLIAYAWAFEGLEDCGCFGEYLSMGPGPSILKNIVLIAVLAGVGWALRPGESDPPKIPLPRGAIAAAGLLIAVVPAFVLSGDDITARGGSDGAGASQIETGPYGKYSVPTEDGEIALHTGTHLVALLSATCEHCMASVPGLNAIAQSDAIPGMVALMFGNESDVSFFRSDTQPQFPDVAIPALEFMGLIDSSPPELVLVKDGSAVRKWTWDDTVPTLDTILSDLGAVSGSD